MFGDLFEEEEDFSFLSNTTSNGKKAKLKDSEVLDPRGETGLSGLRNQGGTCYLNSLLQTLLFTPEFREAVFALSPEELGSLEDKDVADSKVRIIPLQLQQLFAQLLLVDQQAASTTDLTSSFGWDNNEETGQQDVQELNRILFSALESSLESTSGHNLINNLYHGTVVNRIRCQECGYVSERQEDFLDLTVAVKDRCSLEDSLYNMYVEEEIFDGDNLYRCGACDKLVPAAKSAKLGKLPPFLTLSLLRFNFDFSKCERYKETSRYTFPTKLNIRPFCEQQELDDIVQTYELFSVIIHKGSCYGGHYHVYIRDVDELGLWGNAGEEQDCPAVALAAVIAEAGADKMLPLDQLSQKLLEHTGSSWNKIYRKKHGALRKFLQNHSSVFQLTSDGSLVGLSHTENAIDPQCCKTSSSGKIQAPQRSASHWFDFNDSTVQSIQEQEIEKQFQGKESAYMLFYRKSQLTRPAEAKGNAQFGVPAYLIHQMDQLNIQLQQKRKDADIEAHRMNVHLHLSSCYHFVNGALHPVVSQENGTLEISVDQRGTVQDLRKMVFEVILLLQFTGILNIETGWHLRKMDWCYEAGDPLSEEDSTLKDLNIQSGDTFVITEGRLPPKGFLKLPVWLYCQKTEQNSVNHVFSCLAALQISGDDSSKEPDSDLSFVGHIELSKEASLQEMKLQIMTLPVFEALGIPSPDFLRIWTLENKRLAKVLRFSHLQISDYKLGLRTTLCVEPLQAEECLGAQDLLLRVQLSVPGEFRYFPPMDIAWNISRGCTASSLRQRIATHCSLPADKVEIAKYLLEKHEWLPISSWTQHVSKKKKKKKKTESLQGAPYYLKDGDIIGVKNLLLDDKLDFSSENDYIAKEKQRQHAENKKNSPSSNCSTKVRTSGRKPESSLSIRVGVFR
uniref:Ubiquitin carboxyl-terminal hydrolase n=1 Tax=Pyxicephalus adspersus TaxID=30357 RepID=A0AAV2ZNL8_PYXAD|nr:TPA: hypothetical protein GDO54_015689 [Pyxicephalus adspersus]